MARFDLRAAFYRVKVNILLKSSKILGLPIDLVKLIKVFFLMFALLRRASF
jgi:hypothetical protein